MYMCVKIHTTQETNLEIIQEMTHLNQNSYK